MKVLIVDDDRIIRKGLKKIIERIGEEFEVIGEAENGKVGLESIALLKPDIVITDVKMPIMNGIELIGELNNREIKCKIIVLSGFDEYKFVRESLKSGAVDYLLKPIENEELKNILYSIKNNIEEEREKEIRYKEKLELSKSILLEQKLIKLLSEKGSSDIKSEDYIKEGYKYIFVVSFTNIKKEYVRYLNKELRKNISSKVLKNKEISICMFRDNLVITCSDSEVELIKDVINYAQIDNIVYSYRKIEHSLIEEFNLCIEDMFCEFYGERMLYNKEIANYTRSIIYDILDKLVCDVDILDKKKLKLNLKILIDIFKDNKINPKSYKDIIIKLIDLCILKINDFESVYKKIDNDDFYIKQKINYMKEFDKCNEFVFLVFSKCIDNIKSAREMRSDNIIEFSKEYIRFNYNKNISLKEVADKVYLNSNYFSELFKSAVGKNFSDYLVEIRVERAKGLFKTPGIKIYEVANEVGYKDQGSFNRVFKRVVGMSPREYINLTKV